HCHSIYVVTFLFGFIECPPYMKFLQGKEPGCILASIYSEILRSLRMLKERLLLATFILTIGSLAGVCQSATPTQDRPAKESGSDNSSQAAKSTQPEPDKSSPETPKKAAAAHLSQNTLRIEDICCTYGRVRELCDCRHSEEEGAGHGCE